MSAKVLLLVGTKKGLFLFTSPDRRQWSGTGPFHPGREINHAIFDARSGRIFATANDSWFGCEIVSSPDLGQQWESAVLSPKFPENSGVKLERLWHIEPGRAKERGVLFAGVAPAALFRTEDNGQTWREMTNLTSHPTRAKWNPGAGGLCLHSIVVDRTHPTRLFVGISAVGVFRSEDGGANWQTANHGTRAEFLPEKQPEYGQCVHKLLMSAGANPVLYQQNHCGVYRSASGGRNWHEISAGLSSDFGFALALHPRQMETLYVLPLQGPEFRCPLEGKLRVFCSRDSGSTWAAQGNGLPEDFYGGVYREGMAADALDPAGIYFGTNTGKVFHSDNEGETWQLLADNLPPVFSVATGEIA